MIINKYFLPFMEADKDGGGGTGTDGTENKADEGQDKKSYSEEELQSKIDEALINLRTEYSSKLEENVRRELEEKERLSKLTEKQRQDEEFKKRTDELDAKEKRIANVQLKADVISELSKLGISTDALSILVSDEDTDSKKTLEKINALKKVIEKSNTDFVQKKMNDNSYVPGTGNTDGLTVEDFKKMDYKQKAKLYNENRTLYNDLTKKLLNGK